MRIPTSLEGLLDLGIVDVVIRPLMAGKEAQVFLVESEGELRVAKIYKEATQRSFRQRAIYAEGRRVKGSRRQRAIEKRSRYGREQEELAWKSAEVDALYRLTDAGVRVPAPYHFVDGVLVMELIHDGTGEPAPRLVDVRLSEEQAHEVLQQVVREVCRMLCAGLVHGDLSDFNILMPPEGPVIIDLPQAVDAAANNNARKLLIRDLDNLQGYLARWAPELRRMKYGLEMWDLYDRGVLEPESPLTGRFKRRGGAADTSSILREIQAAEKEERARRERLGLAPVAGRSKYAEKKRQARLDAEAELAKLARRAERSERSERSERRAPPPAEDRPKKKKKRRRRRGRSRGEEAPSSRAEAPREDRAADDTLPDDLDSLLIIDS